MIGFLLRRAASSIPVLVLTSIVVFSLIHLAPGDPVDVIVGEDRPGPEVIAAIRHDMAGPDQQHQHDRGQDEQHPEPAPGIELSVGQPVGNDDCDGHDGPFLLIRCVDECRTSVRTLPRTLVRRQPLVEHLFDERMFDSPPERAYDQARARAAICKFALALFHRLD